MRALTRIAFGTVAATLAVGVFAGFGQGEEERKNVLPEKVAEVLSKAESWELISLDPQIKENGKLHGFDELGRTAVKDAETRKTLMAALAKGLPIPMARRRSASIPATPSGRRSTVGPSRF
jgi:hypothetical protein